MALQVSAVAFELIEALRPLVPRIRARDRSLADQITRAASSIVLNIGEAQRSDPGNKRARFFTAAGSAGETLNAVKLAVKWGYVATTEGDCALALLDRVNAMLWRLTH